MNVREQRRMILDLMSQGHSYAPREHPLQKTYGRPRDLGEIGARFRTLRKNSKMSQARLGEIIHICRQTISEIENGRVRPHDSTWQEFAKLETKHNRPPICMPTRWD